MYLNETMPNWLKKRAFLTPNRPAIVFQGKTTTFKELYDKSYHLAGQLNASGVAKGQFVGLLLRNHIDSVHILMALQLIGVRAVILNNRLTAEEIIWQLKDSQSAYLISEEYLQKKAYFIQEKLPDVSVLMKENIHEFHMPNIEEEINLADICTIMYTSGTTGNPKGVIQTYGNHWWSATASTLNLGLNEDDCWLLSVPLFHISGYSILMKCIIYGMKIVIQEKFDPDQAIADIKKEHVTIMSVVSVMLSRMVEHLKEGTLPSYFRCALLGGGPASLSLLESCVKKGIPVFQTYGMTETSSQIVTLSPEDSIRKLGSAGKSLFPSQLKIVKKNGEEAYVKEPGEIIVKGPNVTIGYLNRETESIHDGWLYTGDIGYQDEDGFLYVLDRRSDLIISGGENIYPAEIEGVLTSHPAIEDAGVIGQTNETWGKVPVAFIVKKSSVTEEEILQYCKERLAKYKIPHHLYTIDQIPRNASKKILRRELRILLNKYNTPPIVKKV